MPDRIPHPRRTAPWWVFAFALTLAGCELPRFGQPDPATTEGGHTLGLWQGMVITAAAVGAFVLGLIVYAAIRFRRRSDDIPSQKPYNIPFEIAYTVTPVVIVAVLFAFSVVTQGNVDHTVERPDLTVNVTGFQWGWQFEYPDQHVTITGSGSAGEMPTLVLPAGQVARLVLRTADVNHSFWVPAFLNKRDMIAGVDNQIDVTPVDVGTFDGRCAEYCALDHWRMAFRLQVVPPDQLESAIAAAAAATGQGSR
ncbi:MAG: cytochrome c oxidase subunit II [Acidimicrobiales bacterium]